MNNTALLIIDVQNGFFLEQRSVHNGPEIISTIKTLIAQARAANIPIIYVQHNTGDDKLDGTPLWEIHNDIAPTEQDTIIQKYTPESFHETNLETQLQANGIKHLVLMGFTSDYCIDTTCRRAWSLGYNVTLVKDAHSTFDSPILPAQPIIEHLANVLSTIATVVGTRKLELA